jgi:hypothetical protein
MPVGVRGSFAAEPILRFAQDDGGSFRMTEAP